jgi:hypothetical protein
MKELIRINRDLIKEWAFKNLNGKVFKIGNHKIKLSNSDIKSVLNKGHTEYIAKNNLLYNLQEVFDESIFIKTVKEAKEREKYKYWHYYQYKEIFYINIVEYKGGEFKMHAITDHLK